jgi:hypothetical protein
VSKQIVSYGGGVNGTALLVGLLQAGERPDAILFADTGGRDDLGEKPKTQAHLWYMAEWLARVNFPQLQIVIGTNKDDGSLEQQLRRLNSLPSRVFGLGSCSDTWKIAPQRKWARAHFDGPVQWIVGIDADEAHRADPNGRQGDTVRFPLIEWGWGREECIAAIRSADLPVPVKSACFYCPSSKKHEVIALAREHPDLFARAVAMEDAALSKLIDVKGLGRQWSWRDLVAADHAQFKMFPEPSEANCACYDGGDE